MRRLPPHTLNKIPDRHPGPESMFVIDEPEIFLSPESKAGNAKNSIEGLKICLHLNEEESDL